MEHETRNREVQRCHSPPATILVIESYQALCEMLGMILRRRGFHVLTATDPLVALDLAGRQGRIDLLLSEVLRTGLSCEELATRFLALHPRAAVVFVRNIGGPADPPIIFEILQKPFTVRELLDAVRSALTPRTK